MAQIIQFPTFKSSKDAYTSDLLAALERLQPEAREIVKRKIDEVCEKYTEMFKGHSISLPSTMSPEQEDALKPVLQSKNRMIQDIIVRDLITTSILYELSRVSPS